MSVIPVWMLAPIEKFESKSKLSFWLVFVLIVISGNPAMKILDVSILYPLVLMVFGACAVYKRVRFLNLDAIIVCSFLVIVLYHIAEFDGVSFFSSASFMIRLLIALLVIRLVPNFISYYISIMAILVCVSLVFYIPVQLGLDLGGMLSSLSVEHAERFRTVIPIHNFHYEGEEWRNCGMFWEPGAFAGYLVLALLFNAWINKGRFEKSKINVILVLGLLSTMSTTGMAALGFLVVYFLYNSKLVRSKMNRAIIFPVLLILFISFAYVVGSNTEYIGGKIETQLNSALRGDDSSRIQRLGNLLYDFNFIEMRPFLGWSSNPETRFSIDSDVAELIQRQGNGFTGLIVTFGFVGLFAYFYFLTKGVVRVTKSYLSGAVSVGVVIILLMGEQYLYYPLFFTFLFLIPYEKPKIVFSSLRVN